MDGKFPKKLPVVNPPKNIKPKIKTPKPAPMLGDNRKGRLKDISTDRGKFRLKANRKGD